MNQIICGSAIEELKKLSSNSIQCCITSPPYWGLRDYKIQGQIGLEKNLIDYIERLVDVFEEVRRVLKPDGTFWLNIGDSWAGSWGNAGNRPELDNKPGYQRNKQTHYFKGNYILDFLKGFNYYMSIGIGFKEVKDEAKSYGKHIRVVCIGAGC